MLGDVYLVAGAIWILIHLIMIGVFGSVIIYEDNPAILYLEISMVVLITMLGLGRLIKDIKR
jgi:hypothetical protein